LAASSEYDPECSPLVATAETQRQFISWTVAAKPSTASVSSTPPCATSVPNFKKMITPHMVSHVVM
jgi:hypothetical protein